MAMRRSVWSRDPSGEESGVRPSEVSDIAKLASLIASYAPHDGRFDLAVPGVHVFRISRANAELMHAVPQPGLCIVAQGAKSVLLGKEVYEYDESRVLVYSVDVPVAARVTRASSVKPYLCLTIDFDAQRMSELVWKVFPHGLPRAQQNRAVCVGQTNAMIVSAAIRLIELLAQPGDVELLAPLVMDEIFIRLLRSPVGTTVAQMGAAESGVHKVAKAITWLRANYPEPVQIEKLAELAHMSVSSFHQHFKAVTALSPLQYQKVLRLQEARRLMLSTMLDVTTASLQVGYLSASQFSREYRRYFGSSPTKDIAGLRELPANAEEEAPAARELSPIRAERR